MKKVLLTLLTLGVIASPIWAYARYQSAAIPVESNVTNLESNNVLGHTTEQIYFTVNVPAVFNKDIVAPNVVYSVNGSTGAVTIDNSLTAGTGISVTGRTIGLSLQAGTGISVDGNKITNSGITSLTAGTGITIDGSKITNTYSFTPDYTQSGWTRTGTVLSLANVGDSVEVGALTATSVVVNGITVLDGNVTIGNGVSILPDTDLGSDLGSSQFRFNNIWAANINSNSSQAFSGQTTFSYVPTDATISQGSVIINPTTSFADGQLLALGIAGYQRALIDEDGDITLGYNSATSAPVSDYPLNIYGHNGTRVSFVDTSGNGYFAGNVGIGTTAPTQKLEISGSSGLPASTGTTQNGILRLYNGASNNVLDFGANHLSPFQTWIQATNKIALGSTYPLLLNPNGGNVGIGITNPGTKLEISTGTVDGGIRIAPNGIGTADHFLYSYENGTGYKTLSLGASTFKIYTGTGTSAAEQLRITSTGSVGIGTTNPTYKLHVAGDGQQISMLQNNNAINPSYVYHLANATSALTTYAAAEFGGTASYPYIAGVETGKGYTISKQSNYYFTINTSGNVGIGTTAPEGKLHVVGQASNYPAASGTNPNGLNLRLQNSDSNLVLDIGGNGANGAWLQATNRTGLNSIFPILLNPNGGNVGIGTTAPTNTLQIGNTSSGFTGNQFLIGNSANALALSAGATNNVYSINDLAFSMGSGAAEKVRITAAGNVGIGTTAPTSKLHLSGAVTGKALAIFDETGDQDIFTASASGVPKVVINHAGNVGIGLTSPATTLQLGGSSAALRISYSTASYGNDKYYGEIAHLGDSPGGLYFTSVSLNDSGSAGIVFRRSINNGSSYAESMRITKDGNVGIGTTIPGAKIEVNGNIYSNNTRTDTVFSGHPGIHIANFIGSNGYWALRTSTTGSFNLDVFNNDNELAALTVVQGGNVGIGTTAPGEKLEVTGNIKTSSLTTGTVYSNAGVLTNTDPSDFNLKDNILSLPDGTLDKVLGLRPVSYTWKSTGDGALGFIAQDVATVFPELVSSNSDGTLGLYTTQFIPVLAKAIQEQQLLLEDLQGETLQGAIATNSAQIAHIEDKVGVIEKLIAEIKEMIDGFKDKFTTKQVCLSDDTGELCVDKAKLQEIINNLPSPSPSVSPSPSPSIDPSPTATPSATLQGETL